MSDQQNQPSLGLTGTDFANAINRHGYPFQYRTLKAARDASDNRSSPWIFQVSEFPVEVRGKPTRIDYVLQRKPSGFARRDVTFEILLVVECKRANPRMKRWCFARAPYVRRNSSSESLLSECLIFSHEKQTYTASVSKDSFLPDDSFFHVAQEVKAREETGDDRSSSGRGAIEGAATQVNLGLNGLVEHLRNERPPFSTDAKMTFIPVIVTTAELFAAGVDLSEGDIELGELDAAKVQLAEKEWLFYQYPVSPGIKHSVPQAKPDPESLIDLGKALDANYLRTVAIVQGKHIEKFLARFGAYFD